MARGVVNLKHKRMKRFAFNDLNTLALARMKVKHTDPSISVFLWGPPGIGKSTMVREIAQELDIGLLDVRLSTIESIDLRGFPKIEGGKAEFIPFDSILPFPYKHGEEGILFLDEFNLAPPDVQKACYQLILDRQLGSYKLPEGWRVVAASNRPEDAPGLGLQKLAPPLANRFIHIQVDPPVTEEARLDLFRWYYEHNVHASVIAFLKWKPDAIYDIEDARHSMAWPSPRSWEFVSKQLRSIGLVDKNDQIVGNYDILFSIAADCVGKEKAVEFATFCEIYKELPDPKAILQGGKYSIRKDRPDVLWAICSSIVAYMRSYSKDKVAVRNFVRFLENIPEEFGIYTMKECCAMKEVKNNLFKHGAVQEYFREHRLLFKPSDFSL